MEIERKFRLERFPEQLPLLEKSVVCQGYLSTRPAVRIRSSEKNGQMSYILCIKGKGKLARQEIEKELTEQEFEALKSLLPIPMIFKDYRVFELEDGHLLECSLVDNRFAYAEVEFDSVEEANAFVMPPFLLKDVTEDPYYSMSGYWRRKQITVSFEL